VSLCRFWEKLLCCNAASSTGFSRVFWFLTPSAFPSLRMPWPRYQPCSAVSHSCRIACIAPGYYSQEGCGIHGQWLDHRGAWAQPVLSLSLSSCWPVPSHSISVKASCVCLEFELKLVIHAQQTDNLSRHATPGKALKPLSSDLSKYVVWFSQGTATMLERMRKHTLSYLSDEQYKLFGSN